MSEHKSTLITIPRSPANLTIYQALAATDPEVQAAIIADTKGGWRAADKGAHTHVVQPHTDVKDDEKVEAVSGDVSRDELKAHLELNELKVDSRLKDFEQRVTDGIGQVNQSLLLLDRDMAAFRGIKGTIILNSIISVIAIVGIVVGVMAYGVSSFDSGRDTSALINEIRQQSVETKQLLEQMKAQQSASQIK